MVGRDGGVGSLLPLPPLTLPPLSLPKAPGTNSIPPQRPAPDITTMTTKSKSAEKKSQRTKDQNNTVVSQSQLFQSDSLQQDEFFLSHGDPFFFAHESVFNNLSSRCYVLVIHSIVNVNTRRSIREQRERRRERVLLMRRCYVLALETGPRLKHWDASKTSMIMARIG